MNLEFGSLTDLGVIDHEGRHLAYVGPYDLMDKVYYTKYATLILLHLSAMTILVVTILVTGRLIHVIRNRDMETERLNMQLMEAGKMASLGELSAGGAHEINNPLPIILTERQILLDLAERNPAVEETFKKDFDPFFTTKPAGKSKGLGLSICYSIVQHLGGTISVRSEAGEGTEFTLELPFNPPMKLREKGTPF